MFIPNNFKIEHEEEQIAFMKKYSFATIITAKNNIPIATQLPFVVNDNSDKLILTAHFAKNNEQVAYISKNTSLVIFTEPHAYISPLHYDKVESVPTWDYIAVHAYGTAKIITDEEAKINALEQMILFYEKDYLQQWNNLSEKFKKGMMQGIVIFELEVNELQGQKKLSQNKTKEERQRIIQQLKSSPSKMDNDLASYIQDTL
jgi:transcriptional regulator